MKDVLRSVRSSVLKHLPSHAAAPPAHPHDDSSDAYRNDPEDLLELGLKYNPIYQDSDPDSGGGSEQEAAGDGESVRGSLQSVRASLQLLDAAGDGSASDGERPIYAVPYANLE
ncbi:PREDICTED: uncharacterized protein LOC106819907, partial [Priapulus caudatus]|uniref:Uncharacterized protein LOC106819907 n=1 Tax=Priapulus caudatus TaxID=37621 RepID=A0ABM1F696_PRICU